MGRKKKSLLSKEQEDKLQSLIDDMMEIAANVVDEYKDLDFSELAELSGSITQIHEGSPFMNEIFEGDSWKKILSSIPTKPSESKKDKDNDTE